MLSYFNKDWIEKYREHIKILFHIVFGLIPFFFLFNLGLEKNNILFPKGKIGNLIPDGLTVFLYLAVFIYLILMSVAHFRGSVRKELFIVLIIGIILAPTIYQGPFFQPPSDPVFHADVLWDYMGENAFDYSNRGFINKSIFYILFHLFQEPVNWTFRMNLIYLFHYITNIAMISAVYFSSRLYGLNKKWSFVSVILMVLFFGTDRFSYFTYYSLAPSGINMPFYWLISALVINATLKINEITIKSTSKIIYIYILGIALIPLIYYNHKQEAGFLLYIYMLAFLIFILKLIQIKKWHLFRNYFLIPVVVTVLFFPFALYFKIFPKLLLFSIEYVEKFSLHVSSYGGLWILGRLNGPRILETLGVIGFLPLVFVIILILVKSFLNSLKNNIIIRKVSWELFIPGLLPFWILLIPFNLMVWISLVPATETFWRACFATQFWITVSYIFSIFETRANSFIQMNYRKFLIK